MSDDICDYLHEDYCTFEGKCRFQRTVFQDGIAQTFPGCSATSEDVWERIR
jgi:hypothetical protein